LIRNSKHLTYLALIVGIGVVVNKLIEFQFSSIASARIHDPEKLTAFFGFWFSTANVVSLGIQLLITQRVVGLIGVGRSLFIFPGALFAGALAVLNTPVLWAGTTLKVLDISLKQSINKATTELLILPIPMAIKSHAKTFIDIFVDTTATGIGGIMLIFLINGFNLSVRAVCIMILLLLCLWIYFAIRVRKEYIKAFEEKISFNRQRLKRKDIKHSDADVMEGIRRTLQSGSTNQILFLLTTIAENKDPGLMKDVIPLLKHDSPQVRRAALACLNYSQDHTITQHIEPLLKDPDNEVRSRAFACLLAHTRQNRSQFINAYMSHPDLAISGAALVGLATESRDNPVIQKEFNLEQRIFEKINLSKSLTDPEAADSVKIILARAIGYGKLKTHYPLLMQYLKDENPVVLKQAILSAGSTEDLSFVRPLLTFLPGRTNRPNARKALARYASSEIIPVLMEVINEKDIKTELLIQLPSLAESMDTQQAIDFLFELIQHHDTTAKLEALEALHKIKAKFPHLTINGKRIMPILMEEADLYRDTLAISYAAGQRWENAGEDSEITLARIELNKLLESKLDNILERIFRVLGLSYPPGIILPLYKDIRNPDKSIRMNTLELLDNFLQPPFKKLILPIIETTMHHTLSEEIMDRLALDIPNMITCFELLIKGEDDQIKLAVLALINALNQPELFPLIQLAAQDDHSKVKMFAKKLLATE
ncbi:MAG: HEAT repeat domain-containing protein, partial [Saprospiraceae bacterium]|nr:HEAT repeat domain-containing protein [Saprospiraceae bacterium]